jgi:hypothetical protein
MSGLPEWHPVQRVGPPARWEGTDHKAGDRAYRPVEDLGAFDSLGDRHRLGGA